MSAGPDPRVVLVTAPDEHVAEELARRLVGRHLAACVHLLPRGTSIYRWEGTVQEDLEVQLVIKTTSQRLAALERLLAEEHPYDVPECIALAPTRVEPRYLAWLQAACEEAE